MCSEYICEGAAEGPTCLLSKSDSHSMLVLQTYIYLLTEGKGGLFVLILIILVSVVHTKLIQQQSFRVAL
jgi:hypothetical protein